jgi:hypothetical protein
MERINRNTVEFAPEMGRYLDAQLWLQAAISETVAAFLSTASPSVLERPNFKSGLAKIRSGNTTTIDGAISTLLTEGLSDGWRRDRALVLVAIAPKAVRLLLPDQLHALHERATEVAAKMTDQNVKGALTSFAGTLESR